MPSPPGLANSALPHKIMSGPISCFQHVEDIRVCCIAQNAPTAPHSLRSSWYLLKVCRRPLSPAVFQDSRE